MIKRIPYDKTNPGALEAVRGFYRHITSIDKKLRALIELRISQINGCVYCVDLHSRQAREAGETQQRLDCVAVWHESEFYTPAERAALAWAEALTHISAAHAPDDVYEALRAHFTDQEVVDLTLIISMMNFWNRLAVGLRRLP